MDEGEPRRLTLLYQLYLAHQASRRFMRLALSQSGMSGEEYALYSYLFANGPRTLSAAARDFGLPITTLSTMLAPAVEAGEIERLGHPTDRRARLLALTDLGRERLQRAMPAFTAAYRSLLRQLEEGGAELESIYEALGLLRSATLRANELLAAESEQEERDDQEADRAP